MKNLQKVMAISLFPLLMSHVCQAQKPYCTNMVHTRPGTYGA